jgi:hypothetical protein
MRKIFLLTSLIFLAFCAQSIAQNSNASPEAPKKFANEAEKKAYYNSINPTVPEFKNQAEKDAWVKKQQPTKIDADKVSRTEAAISTEAEKDAYLNKRQNIVYMTQAEFNSLPASKQTAVLADKNFVIIK